MTPTKPAGHEDVPKDVWDLAGEALGAMNFTRLILQVRIARAILADRSRRAKAPTRDVFVWLASIEDEARKIRSGPYRESVEQIEYCVEQLRAVLAKAPAEATSDTEPLTIEYTNYRGEHSTRILRPRAVWFGSTDWHPEPQWLLKAWDVEKAAERDFALKDFGPAPAQATELAPDVKRLIRNIPWIIEDHVCGGSDTRPVIDVDGLVGALTENLMALLPADAPDVKGLVLLPREPTEAMYEGAGQPGSTFASYLPFRDFVWCYASMLDAYSLSRLSAPPAEATSAYLNAAGIPELPVSYPVDWRAHPAEHGLTPLYKHPAPPAEAKPVAWSVKPLEWRKLSDAKTADTYGCRSIAGFSFGQYFVNSSAYGSRWNFSRLGYAEIEAASEEDAKAAAQADYEQRITSAIIVHPDPRAKAAEAVPEGMVLAPTEATEAMALAAIRVSYPAFPVGWSPANAISALRAFAKSWTAALAAAPQPLSTGAVK